MDPAICLPTTSRICTFSGGNNFNKSLKQKTIDQLLQYPVSSVECEKTIFVSAFSEVRNDPIRGKEKVVNPEYEYLTKLITLARSRSPCIAHEGRSHKFVCKPTDPGAMSDMLVWHYVDTMDSDIELLPPLDVSSSAREILHDIWAETYTGDTGGSEKRENDQDVAEGDQKRVYDQFYRDTTQDSREVRPHRLLVSAKPSEEDVKESLDRYFKPEGTVADLEKIVNCDPGIIWKRPEASSFKAYCRAGGYCWLEEEGKMIPDSGGEPCFTQIGLCNKLQGKEGVDDYVKVTRRVRKAVAKLVSEGIPEGPRNDLQESLKYVMPPTTESAMINSLTGQAKKQKTARPSPKVRALLKAISNKFSKRYPQSEWAPDTTPVGMVLHHYFMDADDKAIGWSAHVFPGTRGNIQRDAQKVEAIILLAKVRLALRFAWAGSVHTLNPREMISEGLMDPAVNFIKGEGHPPKKIESQTWRLIWNISEVDRLLDSFSYVQQDKLDILTFQDGPRTENGVMKGQLDKAFPLAMGVGHDDYNLERTFAELEALQKASSDGLIRASDASGWDLSVSATTFWTGLDYRLSRSTGKTHCRTMLVNAFYQCSWVICTGTTLFESNRFGITGSGSGIATSKNSGERSNGSKFGQVVYSIGGLENLEKMSLREIHQLASDDSFETTSTGDDNLHSHDIDTLAVGSLGTFIRDSVTSPGALAEPVPYLSHAYGKSPEGVWSCKYANGPKLFHRLGVILGGSWDKKSELEKQKAIGSIAGQRFVLRNTPELHDVYVRFVRALCPELEMPDAQDTGEA